MISIDGILRRPRIHNVIRQFYWSVAKRITSTQSHIEMMVYHEHYKEWYPLRKNNLLLTASAPKMGFISLEEKKVAVMQKAFTYIYIRILLQENWLLILENILHTIHHIIFYISRSFSMMLFHQNDKWNSFGDLPEWVFICKVCFATIKEA